MLVSRRWISSRSEGSGDRSSNQVRKVEKSDALELDSTVYIISQICHRLCPGRDMSFSIRIPRILTCQPLTVRLLSSLSLSLSLSLTHTHTPAGRMVNHVTQPELIRKYSDQFNTMRAFGCRFDGKPYQGTLFRLPLRTSSSSSRLSKKTHLPEHVLEELVKFFQETPRCLVFLKHVETIRILRWNSSDNQPTMLYETGVQNVTRTLRELRSAAVNAPIRSKPTTFDYELRIKILEKSSNKQEELRYIIANQLGGPTATQIAKSQKDMNLLPWAGCAVRLSNPRSKIGSLNGKSLSLSLFFVLLLLSYTHTQIHTHTHTHR